MRPKLHIDEVDVDEGLVRGLLADQHPEWARLPVQRVASSGTDNAIFRLGPDLAVRMPRIGWAVQQVGREATWLPHLAPHLPVEVPEPLATGEAGRGYPFPWLVYRWLDGSDALATPVDDWLELAHDIAGFVTALQRVDPKGAVAARSRGAAQAVHDESTRRALHALDGEVDVDRAKAIWGASLEAGPFTGRPVWVHGDLLPGNLLLGEGRLTGVIDWSAAGVGDPACEAMVAWAMPADARTAYRAALDIDDATWARGKGWVIEQAARFIPYYAATIPDGVAAARRRLQAVLADEG